MLKDFFTLYYSWAHCEMRLGVLRDISIEIHLFLLRDKREKLAKKLF